MFRKTLVATAIALWAVPAAAQDVTLRMHQFLPRQANIPAHVLYPWADKVEAESGGRIKIDRFDAMALGGSPADLYDQVIDGVVDIIWTLPGYTPGRFPRTEVVELPFMMTNSPDTSRAFWRLGDELLNETDYKDVKVLALWVHGPGVIHSERPVETLSDMKGLKIRAPTRITSQMLDGLGAEPVGMPVPAVPEALSKGVIDAAALPWEVSGSLRTAELVSNHTELDTPIYTAAFVLAMNRDSYEALPDDLRAVIDANSGEALSVFAAENTVKYDGPARDAAIARGNTVRTLDAAETDRWKEASQPTIDGWIAEMDGRGLDGTGLEARMRALIAQDAASPAN